MGFLHDLYAAQGKAIAERTSPYFIADKGAYLSPLDGTVIEGRKAHREHMKRHNVVEAGDMKIGEYRGRENSPMPSIRSDIQRTIQELSSR